VLPLDVYLENEHELYTKAVSGEIVDELKGTVGEKLLSSDPESRVVVNFHGVGFTFVRFFSFSMSLFYLCKTHGPFASYFSLLFDFRSLVSEPTLLQSPRQSLTSFNTIQF
jgi:hypothetical protein